VFLRRCEQRQSRLRLAHRPRRPVEAVKEPEADLILFQHHRHRLGLIHRRLALSATLGVGGQRLFELLGQPQVVHHQPARLVAEDAVDASDGLHEPMPAHRFVDIHGVEARRVEAREPHVADDDNLERIGRVAKPLRQLVAPRLVADVPLPLQRVRRRAGHHHLEHARLVRLAVPRRAERHQLPVQLHADAPAHADDHGLAVHGLQAVLEVIHQVTGDESEAPLGAHHGLELGPPGLELFLALHLLTLGGLFEVGVDPGTFGVVELEQRQAALVIDGHRGLVRYGSLNVVHADVFAEHRPGVGVGQLDGRAGETDEGGVRQGVAHVAGEAVDEVVL